MAQLQPITDRAAWDTATARYTASRSDLASRAEDVSDEALGDLLEACSSSARALLGLRAPDAAGIALKARAILEDTSRFSDESLDDPRTVAMLLDSDWHEALGASVYQDALALSGLRADLAAVQPPGFDPRQWLMATEARTFSRLVFNEGSGPMHVFKGGGADEATGAFEALTSRQREWITELVPVS